MTAGHCGHGHCLDERCRCTCEACMEADSSSGDLDAEEAMAVELQEAEEARYDWMEVGGL